MFEQIKRWYNGGFWDATRVKNVVGKVITQEEYFEITGFIYPDIS